MHSRRKKVFVLGHNGMLGHVLAKFLRERHDVVLTTERRFPDPLYISDVFRDDPDIIVNAAGKIRQKCTDLGEFFYVNTILPITLLRHMSQSQSLVQISTDCVFSGKVGNYGEFDIPDPTDLYGESKAAAEVISFDERVQVIRTSIIGPEINTSYGLLAWFVNNCNNSVNGYVNHHWNGVTTLELSKYIHYCCHTCVNGLRQFTCESSISKYELLRVINEKFELGKEVIPVKAPIDIDRTLVTCANYAPLLIQNQLVELKNWYA